MDQIRLGRSNLQVSRIAFGTWELGGDWGASDDQAAIAAIRRAADQGVYGPTMRCRSVRFLLPPSRPASAAPGPVILPSRICCRGGLVPRNDHPARRSHRSGGLASRWPTMRCRSVRFLPPPSRPGLSLAGAGHPSFLTSAAEAASSPGTTGQRDDHTVRVMCAHPPRTDDWSTLAQAIPPVS
jgi:hypothetical protein